MKSAAIAAAWALLAVAAGFTTWLVLANRSATPAVSHRPQAAETPDYTVADAVVTRFDPAGERRYVLDAKTIEHFPSSGASTLEGVKLDYYDPSGTAWRLTARRGRLTADGNRLALAGDVHAWQLALPNPLRFASPQADVGLEDHTVDSASKVRVWQKEFELQGIGLKANLETNVVTLLQQVRGHYEP